MEGSLEQRVARLEAQMALATAGLHGVLAAILSFRVTVDFTNPVPAITVANTQTSGATFLGSSVPFPGLIQVDYRLDRSIDESQRVELTSVGANIQDFDPIVPIAIVLLETGTNYSALVVANGPPQPQGSPTIFVDYHTALYQVLTSH